MRPSQIDPIVTPHISDFFEGFVKCIMEGPGPVHTTTPAEDMVVCTSHLRTYTFKLIDDGYESSDDMQEEGMNYC